MLLEDVVRFLVEEVRNAGRIERNEVVDPVVFLGKPPEYVHFRHPLVLSVTAVITGNDVMVSGDVSTKLGFTCGRCLEDFDRTYKSTFQQVFSADSREIDLTPDIHELVFVDLPLIPVCKEDCKGLCPTCGKNKNLTECDCKNAQENPKWGALKEFRFIKK